MLFSLPTNEEGLKLIRFQILISIDIFFELAQNMTYFYLLLLLGNITGTIPYTSYAMTLTACTSGGCTESGSVPVQTIQEGKLLILVHKYLNAVL